jgi:hypothetical protein
MNIAQSLMAGTGRSAPLMSPRGTTERRGFPVKRPSGTMRLCEGTLQVPSDESLGYFQGPFQGETFPKHIVRLFL